MPPFQYLGQVINGCLIYPQKVEIRKDNLKALNDLQKLLGDINWLRPSLKHTTDTLSPFFNCSRGILILLHFENLQRMPDRHWLRQREQLPQPSFSSGIHRACSVTDFTLSTNANGSTLAIAGVLEWLHLGHSPAKVLTPYHELVARLIATTFVVVNCWGMSPGTLWSHFQKMNSIGYGNFQTYGSLHWLIFQDGSGNISHIQNFYSLPPFTHLSFQKLFYLSFCQRLSQFSLMLLGMVLLPIIPKIATRLKILFLLKGQSFYAFVMVLRNFSQ
jgi:hypothetical protein